MRTRTETTTTNIVTQLHHDNMYCHNTSVSTRTLPVHYKQLAYVLQVHLSASAENTYLSVIQRLSVTAPCWSHFEAVLVYGDPFFLLQWRFRLSLSCRPSFIMYS